MAPLPLSNNTTTSDNTIQHRLQTVIDTCHPRWTYAIFWQLMLSKEGGGDKVLGWGDGYFNPPDEYHGHLAPSGYDTSATACAVDQQLRRRILRELQTIVGGGDGDGDGDGDDGEDEDGRLR